VNYSALSDSAWEGALATLGSMLSTPRTK